MMTVPNQIQSDLLRVGLVQMCATRDPAENTIIASELIQQAVEAGAHYVQTPEVTTLMEIDRANMFAKSEPEENNTALLAFQNLAKDLKIWLHIGSIAVHVADGRLANRSFLIRPDGKISARYDKIHMFDVRLPNERSYEESRSYSPGTKVVTAELLGTTFGLSVCYDIRFAYLYRALAQAGAKVLAVPAAFTRTTGRAHWHVLLRARQLKQDAMSWPQDKPATTNVDAKLLVIASLYRHGAKFWLMAAPIRVSLFAKSI